VTAAGAIATVVLLFTDTQQPQREGEIRARVMPRGGSLSLSF
jgi:hypothetical protein